MPMYTHHHLKDDDVVGFSFFFAEHLMAASTLWFIAQAFLCPRIWASTKVCAAMICFVAFLGYKRMAEMWLETGTVNSVQRYSDWAVSVPLQVLEFYLMIVSARHETDELADFTAVMEKNRKLMEKHYHVTPKRSFTGDQLQKMMSGSTTPKRVSRAQYDGGNPMIPPMGLMHQNSKLKKAKSRDVESRNSDDSDEEDNEDIEVVFYNYDGVFFRLLVSAIVMILCGFLGETPRLDDDVNRWLFYFVGMTCWAFMLWEIYKGRAAHTMNVLASTMGEKRRKKLLNAFQRLRLIVTVGWALYPVGFIYANLGKNAGEDKLSEFFGFSESWDKRQSAINFAYNIADMVNKTGFALVVYSASSGAGYNENRERFMMIDQQHLDLHNRLQRATEAAQTAMRDAERFAERIKKLEVEVHAERSIVRFVAPKNASYDEEAIHDMLQKGELEEKAIVARM